ncbi:hypothetical protein B0T16DRAFT_453599 [Cercophora newfieldiana]|uniref:Uncharacterized protein n=1 Tax=Cercophora newfieldiana TaxID=92897 RepID=A0AA40CVV7_9PEZI|nr:hypothetical protein B0T16DRAFT_453599 [Cercophora newfieldiana]
MAQRDTTPNFSALAIPHDPLADFQAKMNEILSQANAQLQQTEHHPPQSPPLPPPSETEPPPTTCQGRTPVPNTSWYGWPDCCICTPCFTSFAANTPLVPLMPLQNQFEPSPTVCDMYSPRQRERYLAASATGNVDELLAASRERSAVYTETVAVILEREAEREAMVARAEIMRVSAGNNALIDAYSGMESLGDEEREEWRTDAGGVYSSWNGVVAEREGEEADALWVAAVEGGDGGEEVARLEARWAGVE